MEEQRLLKKHFFLHIIYNMIAFALIFIAFGICMFYMVKSITFSSTDSQLNETKQEFSDIKVNLENLYKIFNLGNLQYFKNSDFDFLNYNIAARINNPQIQFILRSQNGNILNANELGRLSNYFDDILFDSENLDTIYTLKLDNQYHYRCLNFKIDDNSDTYAQLLINVDSEIAFMNSYLKIIEYAVILGIGLSGFASFILSKKTLHPIQTILNSQTEFVQNASHELRTPLTIIQAKQELLLQEPDAQIIDKSEEISLTLNETKRLAKLTKDLMLLVRGANLKLQKEEVNIDEWMPKIVLPYQDIAEAQGKQIVLNLNFGKEISIDSNKIHQLLVILLDNAIKYTENGDKIQINTYSKDNKCVIEVADNGIGISDEGLKHIFDRFYREDKARNRETGGSGLGLSIATMIVKAHNGSIKAVHNQPKGTIFVIKLNR